jgi:hypothetical protein
MKKIICLVVVVLMIAAVAIAASKKVAIKEKDLASLKGTWEGILTYGTFEPQSGPMKLEILNDTVPVKAKLTLDVPQLVATQIGGFAGQQIKENNEGKLTSQGTLKWMGGGDAHHSFEVTLTDAKKLDVFYYYMGMRGDATLTKKK